MVYIWDEIGLNFKMISQKIWPPSKKKQLLAIKKIQEGVAIFVHYNASGNHKLKIVFIVKHIKRFALKYIAQNRISTFV